MTVYIVSHLDNYYVNSISNVVMGVFYNREDAEKFIRLPEYIVMHWEGKFSIEEFEVK